MSSKSKDEGPGRAALVVGAARGIGAAIASTLAASGYRIAGTARRAEVAEAAMEPLGGVGLAMEVTDADSVCAAVAAAEEALGPLDVLIYNAGIADSAPFDRIDEALWSRVIDVDLTGAYRVAHAVVPGMAARRHGRVVFIASIAGLTGTAYTAAYCAAKHGVVGLTRALAAEYALRGVTVNAVCPGFVDTDMAADAVARIQRATGRDADTARAALEAFSPQRRLMTSPEVAHLVAALVADEARGINGQAIALDGGQVMH